MGGGSGAWFWVEGGGEITIDVETTPSLVACAACGTAARSKDSRRVRLRDVPAGMAPVVARWHKRAVLS